MQNCAVCNFKIATYNYKSADGTMHADCERNRKHQPRIRLMLADRHDLDYHQNVNLSPIRVSDDAR